MEKYILRDRGAGIIHALVDIPLSFVCGVLLNAFCAEILKWDVGHTAPNQLGYALLCVAYLTYYVGLETWLGKTVGKYITVTIVVDAQGNIPSFWQNLIRTLCRFIPFEFLSNIIGFYPLHYRLSATYLISKEDYLKIKEANSLERKIEQIGKPEA